MSFPRLFAIISRVSGEQDRKDATEIILALRKELIRLQKEMEKWRKAANKLQTL